MLCTAVPSGISPSGSALPSRTSVPGPDASAGELGVWCAGREPLGFEVGTPFGKFLVARVKRTYY